MWTDLNFAVRIGRCPTCGATLFGDELHRHPPPCCHGGRYKISEEVFPSWPLEYCELISRHSILLTQGAFVNNDLAMASVCVEGPGLDYAPYGILGSNVLLQGRTFHRFDRRNDFYLTFLTNYVDTRDNVPNEEKVQRAAAIDELRSWLSQCHPAGMHIFDAVCEATALQLHIHPEDRPTADEFAAIGTTIGQPYLIPGTVFSVSQPTELDKESLCYPLLFPVGTRCGNADSARVDGNTIRKHGKFLMYQKYFSFLGRLPRVAEQFFLDLFSRAEERRYKQLCNLTQMVNGYQLRRATVAELTERTIPLAQTGRRWCLPSSIPGTPAYCRRNIERGMTVIAKTVPPSLFITATMNTRHPTVNEAVSLISENEAPRLAYTVITSRVFHDLLKQLEKVLRDGTVFGQTAVYLQRVKEFQKRGVDHAHILLGLAQQPQSAEEVDAMVSARLFHGEKCPNKLPRNSNCDCIAHRVFRLVNKTMIHDCHIGRCKKTPEDPCKKGFPKEENPYTWRDDEGRWHYQRSFDDRYVVAYTPALLLAMQAHVNCEIATGDGAAAYIRKYQCKMPDSVLVSLEMDGNANTTMQQQFEHECLEFQKVRYMSSSEAVCRVLEHEMNIIEPACIFVYVHLDGEKVVAFRPDDDNEIIEERSHGLSLFERYLLRNNELAHLRLEEYFEMFSIVGTIPRNGEIQFYPDNGVPTKYAVNRNVPAVCCVSRVPLRIPSTLELYSLRLLSTHMPGNRTAASYKGRFPTFNEAAIAAGLYSPCDAALYAVMDCINWTIPKSEFKKKVEDEVLVHRLSTHSTVLNLYVSLLCCEEAGGEIFDLFWPYMLRVPRGYADVDAAICRDEVKRRLNASLKNISRTVCDFGIAPPGGEIESDDQYCAEYFARHKRNGDRPLSLEQENAMHSLLCEEKRCLSLEGHAGCGKTHLIQEFIWRSSDAARKIVVTSYLANAAKLISGDTTHRAFGLPILETMDEDGACSPRRLMCLVLRAAHIIIIDEIATLHKKFFEMINSLLQEFRECPAPFGGVRVICCGDFGQTCPPMVGANRSAALNSSVKSSQLWKHFEKVMLQQQNRIVDPNLRRLSHDLCNPENDGRWKMPIPSWCSVVFSPQSLVEHVFPLGIIITFRNDRARLLNEMCATYHRSFIGARALQLFAHETFQSSNNATAYAMATPELLAQTTPSGCPPHTLELYIGCRVMILRNINPPLLTNGTLGTVTRISKYVIEILSQNETFAIPRISFELKTSFGAKFLRKQFPLTVAFAMTANKCQGITIPQNWNVGFDWISESFAHGQLYSALTRCKHGNQIRVLLSKEAKKTQKLSLYETAAVTYKELFM